MDGQDAASLERAPMHGSAVSAVLFEAIARVELSSTIHQLALHDLGKAARERDCSDELVSLGEGVDPAIEKTPGVFKPVHDVNERDAGVYGEQLRF